MQDSNQDTYTNPKTEQMWEEVEVEGETIFTSE
jgi:hypothetical protein